MLENLDKHSHESVVSPCLDRDGLHRSHQPGYYSDGGRFLEDCETASENEVAVVDLARKFATSREVV